MNPARRERPRVLLVEDHKEMRRALARLFALAGWDVAECRGLADAYASLATHYGIYDAAVIDLMLADGSGVDVVRDVHATGAARRVVVYTACEVGNARVVAAVEAGADAVLFKPVSFTEGILPAVLGADPGKVPADR